MSSLEELFIHLAQRHHGNRMYLDSGEEAPEGKEVHVGKRGGRYYLLTVAPQTKARVQEVTGLGEREQVIAHVNYARFLKKQAKVDLDKALVSCKRNPDTEHKIRLENKKNYFIMKRKNMAEARKKLQEWEAAAREKRKQVPEPSKKIELPDSDEHEMKMQSSPVKGQKRLGGGANRTDLVDLGNGEQAVFKPLSGECKNLRRGIPNGTMYKREAAAYRVCKFLGWDYCPVTTIKEIKGKIGSVQKYMKDAQRLPYHLEGIPSNVIADMAVYNLIMWNTDRHGGNALASADGKTIFAIDHGCCFPNHKGQHEFKSKFVEEVRGDTIPKSTLETVQKALEKEAELQKILTPLLEPEAIKGVIGRMKAILQVREFKADAIWKKAEELG